MNANFMKIVGLMICGILAIAMAFAGESNEKPESRGDGTPLDRNLFFPKGGLGIVSTNLYIVVSSTRNDRNEMIVSQTGESEGRWLGESATKVQVVFSYAGKIWSKEGLPEQFDLSKAIVVSFENEKVRFFDFQTMFGGYYERSKLTERR